MRVFTVMLGLLCLILSVGAVLAQEVTPPDGLPLIPREVRVETQPDIFGTEALVAQGEIVNESADAAFTSLDLFAEVYDADDELIGEGFGFLVNACGVGMLPDFTLQPGQSKSFSITLEMYEEGTEDDIERVEIIAEGTAVEAEPENPFLTYPDVAEITDREVVMVEWIDATNFRYAVGCDADPFTAWNWFNHDLSSGESIAIPHPRAEEITGNTLERLQQDIDNRYERAYMTFHPGSRRLIFQNEINTLLTAEPDGTFPRLLWDNLARFSLHGYIWLPEERFLAYYYGAYGDPVRYLTGSMLGQRISASIYEITPSEIIPGPSPDGARVVIGQEVNDQEGYYLWSTISPGGRLLFEADLPGNNWPAPVYLPTTGGEAYIYVIRPVNDQARLQCYDTASGSLQTLSILPLELTTDDRAWSWMGPADLDAEVSDAAGAIPPRTLAIAANGLNGGLWTIEINGCG